MAKKAVVEKNIVKKNVIAKATNKCVIRRCVCVHPFQDKRYGRGKRLHNPLGHGKMNTSNGTIRCTVCGSVK